MAADVGGEQGDVSGHSGRMPRRSAANGGSRLETTLSPLGDAGANVTAC